MNEQIESKESKNKLLEFNNDESFVKQLLITEKAKKSIVKPKITSEAIGLNLNLIDSVKKFLEDAKKAEVEKKENNEVMKDNSRIKSDDLTDLKNNQEFSSEINFDNQKEEIGVEFDLLMYKDDEDSNDEDSNDEDSSEDD